MQLSLMKRYSDLSKKALNGILFYLGWGICLKEVINGTKPVIGPLVVLAILVLDIALSKKRLAECITIISVTLLGTLIDSLFQLFGAIHYHGGYTEIPQLAPLWISSLWALYATSLSGSLSWLNSSLPLTIIFGAVGGPFCYLVAIKLGAATLQMQEIPYITIMAVLWAVLLPVTLKLAKSLHESNSWF